jgi:hypothetical protein
LMLNQVGCQVYDTDIITVDKDAAGHRGMQLHE